jgi:hypothetical protein
VPLGRLRGQGVEEQVGEGEVAVVVGDVGERTADASTVDLLGSLTLRFMMPDLLIVSRVSDLPLYVTVATSDVSNVPEVKPCDSTNFGSRAVSCQMLS